MREDCTEIPGNMHFSMGRSKPLRPLVRVAVFLFFAGILILAYNEYEFSIHSLLGHYPQKRAEERTGPAGLENFDNEEHSQALANGNATVTAVEDPVQAEGDAELDGRRHEEQPGDGNGSDGTVGNDTNGNTTLSGGSPRTSDAPVDLQGKTPRNQENSTAKETKPKGVSHGQADAQENALGDGRVNDSAEVLPGNSDSEANNHTVSDGGMDGDNHADSNCASLIAYDKPMKTGSTAVTLSLKGMLRSLNQETPFASCDRVRCHEIANAVCENAIEPLHFLQHIDGEDGMMECLREKGYYIMTSIREPFQRWQSAYLYNRREKARHYGISWTESYEVFMNRIPPCALLGYYDGGDRQCRDDVDARIERIVERYDEIVDLYDEPRGQVEKLLKPFIGEVNTSPRFDDLDGDIDMSRLENETKLYKALKKRRQELVANPRGSFCTKPRPG